MDLEVYASHSKTSGDDLELIEAVTLADLLSIYGKSDEIRVKLGLASKSAFKKSYGKLAGIRNRVMHPVRPLVSRERGLGDVADSVDAIDDLTRRTDQAERLQA